MSRRSSRRQQVSGTQNVSHVPENPQPPVSEVAHDSSEVETTSTTEETTGQEATGDYPAVETPTMTEEELKAKQEAEAAERVSRAKKATGPRRLNANERKVVEYFLKTYIGETDEMTKVIPFSDLEKDMRAFFQPSMKDNVVARGVFNALYDDDTKMLNGVQLTESGAELYFRGQRKEKANGSDAPTGKVSRGVSTKPAKSVSVRTTKYTDNMRLRKMKTVNPRREATHGNFSWDLYEDGMTYQEYMHKPYDKSRMTSINTAFTGPGRNHWDWDLMRGHTALYYADRPEFLEDGSHNPEFWCINNSGLQTAAAHSEANDPPNNEHDDPSTKTEHTEQVSA